MPDFASLNLIFSALPNRAHVNHPINLMATFSNAIIILPSKSVPKTDPKVVIKISK